VVTERLVSDEPRLTISMDCEVYEQLLDVTERRRPKLTKRYVIELALTRLLEEVRGGQLELGLERSDVRRR
jgi:hypothetical protein